MLLSNAVKAAGEDAVADQANRRSSRARTALTLSLLIVYELPLGSVIPGKGFASQLGQEGLFWALTIVMVGYILLVERRPLASIGLRRPTWKTFAFGLAGGLVTVAGGALIYLMIFPALGLTANEAGLKSVQALPLWFQFLLFLRAAVFEEVYYRGFAIDRLTEITGLRWLAALISLAGFTLAHLSYWGWASLIPVAFAGAVLTWLYVWRRDLGACMVAHFVTDAIGFFLG